MTPTEWFIRKSERAICVGMTGTGKSTLCTDNLLRFRRDYPTGYILIIDSKPRYRASHNANGTEVVYKDWVKGDYLDNSVVSHGRQSLAALFRMSNVVILQSLYPNKEHNPDFEPAVADYASQLMRISSPKKHPTLLVIDEFYDIVGGGLAAIAPKSILKTIRAGREMGMAVLAGSQRPRSIPVPIMTEATKFYVFELEFKEDIDYLRKHGLSMGDLPSGHTFFYYRRGKAGQRETKLMELRLAA